MIKVKEDFNIEFSQEMSDSLNAIAVQIGDCIKDMPPLERFYALKTVCEEIDSRCTIYTMMGMLQSAKDDVINSETK